MLSTTNLSIQFEAKPLFEHVSVKFSDGNRYGLIGANGSGKSTLMKILGGELEPSSGDVVLQTGMRMGKLNQNQFAYEDERVLDVVMQGHAEMWAAMRERDLVEAIDHRAILRLERQVVVLEEQHYVAVDEFTTDEVTRYRVLDLTPEGQNILVAPEKLLLDLKKYLYQVIMIIVLRESINLPIKVCMIG